MAKGLKLCNNNPITIINSLQEFKENIYKYFYTYIYIYKYRKEEEQVLSSFISFSPPFWNRSRYFYRRPRPSFIYYRRAERTSSASRKRINKERLYYFQLLITKFRSNEDETLDEGFKSRDSASTYIYIYIYGDEKIGSLDICVYDFSVPSM